MNRDPWLLDFERLEHLADEIFTDVNERNRLVRQNVSAAKQTASIKRKVQQLSTEISRLVDDLDRLSARNDGRMTPKELNRRQDMVEGLLNRRDRLVSMAKQEGEQAERDALFGGISKVGKTWGTKETEETVDLDNSAVSQLQRDKFKQQDEHVDRLIESVQKQNHYAVEIGNELDVHTQLLDDMSVGVNKTSSNVRDQNVRMMKMEDKVKVGSCWGCILLQSVIIVVLFCVL